MAVSNGTAALHLCAMALEVNASSPGHYYAHNLCRLGQLCAVPTREVQFCDIDEETYCIDLQKLRAMLEENPKGTFQGVIPVDFTGHPVNTAEIQALAGSMGSGRSKMPATPPGAITRMLTSSSKNQAMPSTPT